MNVLHMSKIYIKFSLRLRVQYHRIRFSNSAVQVFVSSATITETNTFVINRKAESLKKELGTRHNGLAGDGSESGELVSNRTSLQDVYRQLLITNLEYALDKKIEQDL